MFSLFKYRVEMHADVQTTKNTTRMPESS
jgi:hypothetical protein